MRQFYLQSSTVIDIINFHGMVWMMTALLQNSVLLRQFKQGDENAFKKVYALYAKDLYLFLKNGFVIKSSESKHFFSGYKYSWQLECSMQDIFTKAFSPLAIDAYDGLRPYKNYLFTIAKNHVIDEFRKSKNENAFIFKDSFDSEPIDESQFHTAQTLLEDAQLKTLTEHFVKQLKTHENAVFQMRFKEGVSLEKTVLNLNMTDYRVKKIERHIRSQFFKLMKKNGYLEGYTWVEPGTQAIVFWVLIMWS